jgi:branched-chain amino acid transport system permease protein
MDGLIDASWIFIVAVGLTLTLGVLHILNLAHGNFYAIGAYVAATGVGWYYSAPRPAMLGLLVLLGAALVVAVVMGPLLERLLFRRLYRSQESVVLLATYALSLILEDATKLLWGTNPYFAYEPYSLFGNVSIGGLSYVGYDIFLIGVAVVVGLLLWFGLNRTRSGKLVLSVIFDREMSSSVGIDVQRIFVIAFTIGIFLGALGGVATAPKISIQPGLSVMVVLFSFAVVVIGGFGSIEGAAIAAIIVGLARSVAIHLAPWAEMFIIYLVLACVLAVRPQGIFAPAGLRKI